MNRIKGLNRSRVTRRILMQYFLTLIAFIAVYLLLLVAAVRIISNHYWFYDDPLYQFLNFIREYLIIFASILPVIGWVIITYIFIGRPLRYLDEVIVASEKLANPTEEQIILSEAMKTVQDDLNEVRENAVRSAKIAKEAEQRKNDLIVYLAHDLKTPLTSVIGYLTLLRDETEISETLREKYLAISLDKAERLEELINEFFEITRFNLSNIELQKSNVNLTRMLEQIAFEFKPMLLAKGMECTLDAPADVMMKCDANKMQRVFDNILRNAVFYSYENSVVEIAVNQDEKETSIRFINSGDTIPEEKLGRLFEQFYRLDYARGTNSGGAGLGLAIARQIVTLHGGTINAESENEKIEFTVIIPSAVGKS